MKNANVANDIYEKLDLEYFSAWTNIRQWKFHQVARISSASARDSASTGDSVSTGELEIIEKLFHPHYLLVHIVQFFLL